MLPSLASVGLSIASTSLQTYVDSSVDSNRDLSRTEVRRSKRSQESVAVGKTSSPDRKQEIEVQGLTSNSVSNLTIDLFKSKYQKKACIPKELRKVTFPTKSNLMVAPGGNKSTQEPKQSISSENQFSENATSCLSVWWKKKTNVEDQWKGQWYLLWFVGDNNKADIFFNLVYTKDGKLYSEGLSYKFEKHKDKWEAKERVAIGKREVTSSNKNNLIIKPNNKQVRNVKADYGNFGDFNLHNICSNRSCAEVNILVKGKTDWILNTGGKKSDCRNKTLSTWSSNYSDWRASTKDGLFPASLVSNHHYSKLKKGSSSIMTGTPPTNSQDRYSKVKGCFQVTQSQITYENTSPEKSQVNK